MNILDIQQQDMVTALVPLKEMLGKKGKATRPATSTSMATKNGIIKKVKATEFITVRRTGVQAPSRSKEVICLNGCAYRAAMTRSFSLRKWQSDPVP